MNKEKSTQFMLKLVGDVGTALAAGLLVVGDQSGLLKAMAGAGPLSAAELAERAAIAPRYVEEWLAVMTGAGYVEHDPLADTFALPDEHAMFLTDDTSEYYLGGLFQGIPGLLADPLGAMQRIRSALNPGGIYLMVEPKVADELEGNVQNPFARMLYAMSCLHCVPQSLARGGPGLGACWGERRARALARDAGFSRFERLDIRSPAMAFFALGSD